MWTECYSGIHRLSPCPSLSQKGCNKWRFRNVRWKGLRAEVQEGCEQSGSVCDAVPTAGQKHKWKLERVQGVNGKDPCLCWMGQPVTQNPKLCCQNAESCACQGLLQPRTGITIILPARSIEFSQKHTGKAAFLESLPLPFISSPSTRAAPWGMETVSFLPTFSPRMSNGKLPISGQVFQPLPGSRRTHLVPPCAMWLL